MSRKEDKKIIQNIPKEILPDFIFMHLRNLWAVDGLYYLGIEDAFGTEAATEIDRKVWEVMGKIEARRIKKLCNIQKNDITALIKALRFSGWALDLEDKEIEIKPNKAILRNIRCRVQNTRKQKGLVEFACKPVRWGYLKSFAKEINPNIRVNCTLCPPDKHPENLWCEWEFILQEK